MEFLENLDPLLRSFWYVALPTSVVFAIQTILTFIGSGTSDSIDVDFESDSVGDHAPFQLFSLRNLINFLLGFSWTGISFYTTIDNKAVLIALSILVGLLFVYLFFLIIRQVQKLAEDNSFQFINTVGKTAEVYLTIPEKKSGKGKVIVSVKGAVHELDAMTELNTISSGSVVKVVRIENNNILIVEPF